MSPPDTQLLDGRWQKMSTFGTISDAEIDRVHGNANFGDSLSKRDIVNQALLKAACGYHQGYTARRILLDHKLVNEEYILTAKGREYLWQTFKLPNAL